MTNHDDGLTAEELAERDAREADRGDELAKWRREIAEDDE